MVWADANVGSMEWPQEFYELRRGEGCPMCAEGRSDETEFGTRILAGEVTDAYLQRRKVQRGYTVVVWRGRHVVEPTELSREEAAQYWLEVLEVGRRLERHLEPVKLNYETLGNSMPHLHTHVMPRYALDPRPEWPFPYPEESPPTGEAEFRAEVELLRS
jgi:diadenosine tetraphosphate (Ap4A) HIT family hydrolase